MSDWRTNPFANPLDQRSWTNPYNSLSPLNRNRARPAPTTTFDDDRMTQRRSFDPGRRPAVRAPGMDDWMKPFSKTDVFGCPTVFSSDFGSPCR